MEKQITVGLYVSEGPKHEKISFTLAIDEEAVDFTMYQLEQVFGGIVKRYGRDAEIFIGCKGCDDSHEEYVQAFWKKKDRTSFRPFYNFMKPYIDGEVKTEVLDG